MQNPYPGLFRYLGHYLAIIEHGSLPRAADAVNLTQSALSKSIQRLELEFGTQLLERTSHGMVPTKAGEVLASHFRVMRSELHNAQVSIESLQKHSIGHVTLGAGPSIVSSLLPLALTQLSRHHPGITVDVMDFDAEKTVKALANGELDFILSAGLEDQLSSEIKAEILHIGEACIIVRAEHPLAGKKELSADELRYQSWALPPAEDPLRRQLDILFLGEGLPPPKADVSTVSVPLIKSLVEETDYLTFLPITAIETERKNGILELAGTSRWRCNWVIRLYRRNRGSISPAAQTLTEHLKSVLSAFSKSETGSL